MNNMGSFWFRRVIKSIKNTGRRRTLRSKEKELTKIISKIVLRLESADRQTVSLSIGNHLRARDRLIHWLRAS